ncbi:MAG: HNH endonuclease [Selenomonadaceae bacterium]|nr:HNH endonuclease [Selenomonadaceae bacterium]
MNGEKAEPRVEIIDERHQKFNGVIYTRDKNSGHYSREFLLHRVVWQHFFGEIPKGFDVHHRDCDPSNNNISNMMLLTRAEHRKLHWHPEKWYADHPEALEPIKIEGDHPTPIILDDKHQRFDGMTFGLRQSGHYSAHIPLHCAIWSYFNGEIPIGCVIHHRDLNPDNNELDNLQLMTDSDHKKLHGALKSVEGKKDGAPSHEKDPVRSQAVMLQWQRRKAEENLIEKVCLNCGNTFKTPFARTRYCSHKCARQFRNRKDDDAKLASDEFRGEDGRIYKKGICEYCGKEFVYLRKRRSKCCSQSCYSKYLWRERHRESPSDKIARSRRANRLDDDRAAR